MPQIATLRDLRYTKFTIEGIRGEKHAIFVPDNLHLQGTVLTEDIISILKLSSPSFVLQGVSSLCHPSNLTNPELRATKSYQKLVGEYNIKHGRPERRTSGVMDTFDTAPQPAQPGQAEDIKEEADFINEVLDAKMESVMNGVANATMQTDTWIYITKPNTFQVVLSACVQAGECEPFCLVAAHAQDKAYQGETSKELMAQLMENMIEVSADNVENFDPVVLPGHLFDQWHPDQKNDEFKQHGWDFWSFYNVSEEDSPALTHPITQFPWPHANLFFLFYHPKTEAKTLVAEESPSPERQISSVSIVSSLVDFNFVTKNLFEPVNFNPYWLASIGYIVSGGEGYTKKILIEQAFKQACPTVILDNTTGVAKQFALLLRIIRDVIMREDDRFKQFMRESSKITSSSTTQQLLQGLVRAEILKYIEEEYDVTNFPHKLKLADVVAVVDMAIQRPQVFAETIKVVNPLKDSPEVVLNELSSAICSTYTGVIELGASSVDSNLILQAWTTHRDLLASAAKFGWLSNMLRLAIAVMTLASTTLAVLISAAQIAHHDSGGKHAIIQHLLDLAQIDAEEFILVGGKVMFFLPISLGLLATLQSTFQYGRKWASLYLAATDLASEIHFFLGRTGKYAMASVPPKQRSHFARQKFMSVMGALLKDCSTGPMKAEAMQTCGLFTSGTSEAIFNHINRSQYGVRANPCSKFFSRICSCLRSLKATPKKTNGDLEEPLVKEAADDTPENPDVTAPFSAETYYNMRLLPLKALYQHRLTCLSERHTKASVVVFLLGALGSTLAAFDLSSWIPVSVGATTFVFWLADSYANPQESSAMNDSVLILSTLDMQWKGAPLMKQRSPDMKARLISETEACVGKVADARTAGLSTKPTDLGENDQQTEDDDAGNEGTPKAKADKKKKDGKSA